MTGMVVTPDLVQAVHETECSARGHDLTTTIDHSTNEPTTIRCRHCDRSWQIGEGTSLAGASALARAVCRRAEAV